MKNFRNYGRFPSESLIARSVAVDGELGKGGKLCWQYWEIIDIGPARLDRVALFHEPFLAADYKNMSTMLKIEPLTIPAREAIDIARKTGKMSKTNWKHWYLSNPEVRPW